MKRLVFDQNRLIAVREGDPAIKSVMKDEENLIYIQDANLAEAWKAGPGRLEELMVSLLPYRRRVRLVPTHTQIMNLELAERRPVLRREIHGFNRSDIFQEAFENVAKGRKTIFENWHDAENQRFSQEQHDAHPKVMADYYQELSGAFEDSDRDLGLKGDDSLATRMRVPEIIDTSILDLCLGLAIQRVEGVVKSAGKPFSVVKKLGHAPSFHMVYYLTKYIRVIQKFANDVMGKMVEGWSKKLGNEYFDTLNVSMAPFFDEFLTSDRKSVATVSYQRDAISLFHKRKAAIIDRLADAKRNVMKKQAESQVAESRGA